jgi:hypothetical protein
MGNTSDRTREIPWLRLGLEVSAIVFSILLAFAIDAWWSGVLKERQSKEALNRLYVEFALNRDELARVREIHAAIAQATGALLDQTGPGQNGPDELKVERLLSQVTRWQTFNPVSGTLKSLLASGELDLIPSADLRTDLAGWQDLVEDLNEDEALDGQVIVTSVIPFLEEDYNFRSVIVARDSSVTRPSGFRRDPSALLRNPRFEGMLAARLWRTREILRETAIVQASLDRILDRIGQALR